MYNPGLLFIYIHVYIYNPIYILYQPLLGRETQTHTAYYIPKHPPDYSRSGYICTYSRGRSSLISVIIIISGSNKHLFITTHLNQPLNSRTSNLRCRGDLIVAIETHLCLNCPPIYLKLQLGFEPLHQPPHCH